MNINLKRWCGPNYTIGKLTIEGNPFKCDTLEDVNRDLNKNGIFDNGEVKIPSETCIPFGKYEITLDVVSPKFSLKPFYMDFCKGKLPRLLNVPSFEGILIHVGTSPKHTAGCILVGENKIVGGLINSEAKFKELYKIMLEAKQKGEKIYITIE